MLRTDTPISTWLNQTSTDPAGGPLSARVRIIGPDETFTVPEKRRSIMVTTITGAPTVDGVVLPVSQWRLFISDYPGYQLAPVVIVAQPDDQLLVVQTWRTGLAPDDTDDPEPPPPPPPHGDALLYEDSSGVVLFEDGFVLLLEDAVPAAASAMTTEGSDILDTEGADILVLES